MFVHTEQPTDGENSHDGDEIIYDKVSEIKLDYFGAFMKGSFEHLQRRTGGDPVTISFLLILLEGVQRQLGPGLVQSLVFSKESIAEDAVSHINATIDE